MPTSRHEPSTGTQVADHKLDGLRVVCYFLSNAIWTACSFWGSCGARVPGRLWRLGRLDRCTAHEYYPTDYHQPYPANESGATHPRDRRS